MSTVPFDTRGGQFFIIDGARIHESDLTDAQREAVGLPAVEMDVPAVAEAPAEDAAEIQGGYSVSDG